MNKKGESALMPRLRFSEFVSTGEWKQQVLCDLLDYERPENYIVDNTDYKKYGIPVLTANKSFILGYTDENYGIYDKIPVIIFDDFTVDHKYVDFPFKVKSSAIKILNSRNGNNLKFIYELMNTIRFDPSEHKRYYISVYQNIKVIIPKEKKEQQKIADCLSSLDDLITAEGKKHEALKAHKKGFMQNLFPADGETVPEWRFPEFRGGGEWEVTTLDKVSYYENGKAHENEISENGKYIVVNSRFISTEGEIKKYTDSANLLANEGDILMVLSDVPNGRAIAKCFYVDKDETYTVNQRVCRLTPRNVTGLFLFYIVNRNSYFLSFDDGVNQTNLKKDDVLMCPLVLPKDPKEQQKIASCLSAIDTLITKQGEKIEVLKALKKGLMQGLFPSIEEDGV